MSTVKGQWRLAVAICAVAANVAGCGAPDLAAMRPTVHKPAVLVEIVGSPPFAPSASELGAAGATAVEVVHVSWNAWRSEAEKELARRRLTGLMLVCDDASAVAPGVDELASSNSSVRFLVVSDWPAPLTESSNVAEIAQDPVGIAYSIGALCGDWMVAVAPGSTSGAVYSGVPSLVYVPQGASAAEQKAFFAGLYQTNGNVRVVALPQQAAPSLSSYGYAVELGVIGGNVSPAEIQTLRSVTPNWGCFGTSTGSGCAIAPGHLDPSEVLRGFQALASPVSWQPGEHLVLDLSSVALDDKRLPASVLTAWAALQVRAESEASRADAAFASLPANVRSNLEHTFHLS
ncbi:hypothetical protein [Alicyclobacillus acidocaldarius]|uniref:hypothetical protein n=1 Tax=Alicyclobacillus acidocaldarius TaxID=405212 RepID=UPI000303FB14|nr:hypothetical protein [Alicyclobacillus acidocaldarius]